MPSELSKDRDAAMGWAPGQNTRASRPGAAVASAPYEVASSYLRLDSRVVHAATKGSKVVDLMGALSGQRYQALGVQWK